ncbi:pyridoxamine 5'-phosphate oxidase family protein [Gordonia soli]|uniref:Pyridoxamine 5'-phosphate oxidase putative domain-containing protein n=1 Tax=Gordonia soli NBRC 108243 TaxID=1223545 RepID=M0QLR8_9ACTN|nr:pyridoxamine 5'-phosphate oxidase family protein [Gordonia soli]GAC69251.1 hypothetical protein GS4_23_00460 [Gordonia soli NBRC 108243]
MTQPSPTVLDSLTRKPDRGGDRALLDEVLDEARVGTLSTVVDGLPWSVPMLFARYGDDIIVHGSTGAGALRHVAAGAPVALSAFLIDGLVIADTLFDHSANYRSVVVRGTLEKVDDAIDVLTVLSDKLVPGRSSEVPQITRKESAATLALRLPIVDGRWIAKARTGGPGIEESESWTGVVPVRNVHDDPITYTGETVPESVRRLAAG